MDAGQPRITHRSQNPWPVFLAALILSACGPTPELTCGDPFIRVHEIQGTEDRSPLAGEYLQTEAVSTGWLLDEDDRLYGSFVESHRPDNDTDTAEGLLVVGEKLVGGHRYRIAGTVGEEESGMTVLRPEALTDCGAQSLGPQLELPLPLRGRHIESLEGMRLRLKGRMTLSGVSRMGSHGEAVVSAGDRLYQPTDVTEPGQRARKVELANLRRSIVIDDFSLARHRGRVPWWPDPAVGLPQAGTEVQGLEGIVDHRFGYRLHLSTAPAAEPAPALPALPDAVGNLRVVAFNLLNFFNGDGQGGGFPTSRGAASEAEYERQLDKLVAAMEATGADLFALAELENDGDGESSALAALAIALSAASGRDYRGAPVPAEGLGGDQIAVGLVYDRDALVPEGPALTRSDYPWNDFNRPPMAQRFCHLASGGSLTAIALHLKSKGCGRADDANLDQRDGQGCFNAKRLEAVRDLARWVASEPAIDPSRVLLIGDFNAYSREQPITYLLAQGFRRLIDSGVDGYTYVYRGRAGALDHALAGQDMARWLRQSKVWHINASQPDWLDYRLDGKPAAALYQPTPRRSSDHDPLILDFQITGR